MSESSPFAFLAASIFASKRGTSFKNTSGANAMRLVGVLSRAGKQGSSGPRSIPCAASATFASERLGPNGSERTP